MSKRNGGKHALDDPFLDERAMELFGKPESLLQIGEREILNDYVQDWLHPIWRLVKTKYDVEVEVNRIGQVRDPVTKELYKVYYAKSAYAYIYLPSKYNNGKPCIVHVHELVAEAFCDKPNDGYVVNHINGNKWCNWHRNLEWITPSENIMHAYNTGLSKTGENHPTAKYTDNQVMQVCQLLQDHSDYTFDKIASIARVNVSLVSDIYEGQYWTRISKNYRFQPRNTKASGENNGSATYTSEQAEDVCKLLDDVYLGKSRMTHRQMANLVGVSVQMVDKIAKGRNWTSVSSKHPFYQAIERKVE